MQKVDWKQVYANEKAPPFGKELLKYFMLDPAYLNLNSGRQLTDLLLDWLLNIWLKDLTGRLPDPYLMPATTSMSPSRPVRIFSIASITFLS